LWPSDNNNNNNSNNNADNQTGRMGKRGRRQRAQATKQTLGELENKPRRRARARVRRTERAGVLTLSHSGTAGWEEPPELKLLVSRSRGVLFLNGRYRCHVCGATQGMNAMKMYNIQNETLFVCGNTSCSSAGT
jgi:hypothetical protein